MFLQFCQTAMIVNTNKRSSVQFITVFSKKNLKAFCHKSKELIKTIPSVLLRYSDDDYPRMSSLWACVANIICFMMAWGLDGYKARVLGLRVKRVKGVKEPLPCIFIQEVWSTSKLHFVLSWFFINFKRQVKSDYKQQTKTERQKGGKAERQ